jgi:3D (Asp-Asp-Asp) domain-containing protein
MRLLPTVPAACAVLCLTIGCATHPAAKIAAHPSKSQRICKVRTTAYTHTERGGPRNAIGTRLCGNNVMSASADWSYWPLGTKFRIVATDEIFQVDDYGSALIGTGTIDLYKTSRSAMHRWGVRSVDIDILEWGSPARSLAVLSPRAGNRKVRTMVVALQRARDERAVRLFF